MRTFTVRPVSFHENVTLDAYIPELYTHRGDRIKMPAMLILPGGAYRFHTPNECEQMAMRFCGEGYACFVLRYSVDNHADFPKPLLDASESIWYIRKNVDEFSVYPDRIAVMGFSAGAHLASALCTMWHYPELQHEGMPEGGNRPDASIFGYLPTTFEDMVERMKDVPGFKLHVLAEEGRFADVKSLTTHDLVDERTPPAFMWKNIKHIPESSYRYAEALKAAGVKYEVHVFSDDVSVNGTCDGWQCAKNTKLWVLLAKNWMDYIYGVEDQPFITG